jgi:hypothetical protein
MQALRRSLVLIALAGLVPLAATACDGSGGGGGGGSDGTLQPGQCRGDADCAAAEEYCAVAGPEYCGGAGCLLTTCTTDADCQAEGLSVCELVACCGGTACVPGCDAQTPCPEGQSCTADNHCVAQSCASEACPGNFNCGTGSEQICIRRTCSSDADCDGYCVLGNCHATPGACDLPSP